MADQVALRLSAQTMRNVQFWINSSEDVSVAWEAASLGSVFTIYLDGVDSVVMAKLIFTLLNGLLLKYREKYNEDEVFTLRFE